MDKAGAEQDNMPVGDGGLMTLVVAGDFKIPATRSLPLSPEVMTEMETRRRKLDGSASDGGHCAPDHCYTAGVLPFQKQIDWSIA